MSMKVVFPHLDKDLSATCLSTIASTLGKLKGAQCLNRPSTFSGIIIDQSFDYISQRGLREERKIRACEGQSIVRHVKALGIRSAARKYGQ